MSFFTIEQKPKVVPEEEWDAFIVTLRKYLATAFRLNGSGQFALDIQDRMQRAFFDQLKVKKGTRKRRKGGSRFGRLCRRSLGQGVLGLRLARMGGWWSWVYGLLYGVGGLTCAGVAMLVAFQEKLVYVPVLPGMKRGYPILPSRLQLRYQDVWLNAKDGVRLHSWYIEAHATNPGPTILFFQENAGNIAHRLQFVEAMVRRLQCNVFMLSYRGYGESAGIPSQHGLQMDAQAALDYLSSRKSGVDPKRIVVFGRSLGGAVGAGLVRDNPGKVAGLILENTFTSILDMAGVVLPVLRYIVGGRGGLLNWFVKSPWKTIELIKHVDAPILFLSGQLDEMVPPAHMQQLYEAAQATSSAQHTFVEFPDGMHMDTWMQGGERYWRSVKLFLQNHAPSNGHSY